MSDAKYFIDRNQDSILKDMRAAVDTIYNREFIDHAALAVEDGIDLITSLLTRNAELEADRGQCNKDYCQLQDKYDELLQASQQSEWVSVEDRLPEIGEAVSFVVTDSRESDNGRVLGGRFSVQGGLPCFTVPGCAYAASHWQPLPAPPNNRIEGE